MKIDMHFHSKKSDGNKSPAQIIEAAKDLGLEIIFCTDHDFINDEFVSLSKANNFKSAYSTEISSKGLNGNIHLTYYSKKNNPDLKIMLDKVILSREQAINAIFHKLNMNGFNLDLIEFYNYYLEKGYNVPNLNVFSISNFIYDEKYYHLNKSRIVEIFGEEVDNISFLKGCLKRNGKHKQVGFPEEVNMFYPDLKKIMSTMDSSSILSVAHPSFTFKTIEDFSNYLKVGVEYGINAIEINTFTPANWIEEIISLSRRYNLYLTFGSDTHFQKRDEKHGDFGELNSNLDSLFIDKNLDKYLNLLLD